MIVKYTPIAEKDLPLILKNRNSKHVMDFSGQNDFLTMYDQRKWYTSLLGDKSKSQFCIFKSLSLEDYENNKQVFVGVVGLQKIDLTHRNAEFNIFIQQSETRKGYGEKALDFIINYGFSNLNLHKIYGVTFFNNPAQYLFEKVGFKKEGVLKEEYYKNGSYVDAIRYGILR